MHTPESLSSDLLTAYKQTHYHINTNPPFYLKPDAYSSELVKLHATYRVKSSAYITAWNPRSELTSDEQNCVQHKNLGRRIEILGYPYIQGYGEHPCKSWPAEMSYLILGINREDARALGKSFEQNAIVFTNANAVPQLIILV